MKKLILIDSDGTLRYDDGTISDELKRVTGQLIALGNIIVVCTARPRYHTLEVSKELGSSKYIISSNGSEIYDTEADKVIYCKYIDKQSCQKIYEYAKENDIRIVFVLDNIEYATMFTRNENQVLLTDDNFGDILNNHVKQVMIRGTQKEKILTFKNIVLDEFKMNILDSSDSNKEEVWFSIVSREVSKGNALIELAKYLNVSLENTIAIGNDNNDISMLKLANKGVAVRNATEDVLSVADEVIPTNNENGVAVFLEKLLNEFK